MTADNYHLTDFVGLAGIRGNMKQTKLEQQCQHIRLILSDVDGVFTDGGIAYDNQGIEIKQFHVRDGLAVKLWQRAGHRFGVITGRSSHIVKVRATELGVDIIRQGFEEKLPTAKKIMEELQLTPEQVCYIGDDLPDLALIEFFGLGVTVSDGCEEARLAADYVTNLPGGHGAVRELVELILKAQKQWDELIRKYRLS
jgi:3-deoxy-D-manno-octulosonate 8-phosphate phosphatase (KDO 8-P phosphatase)